MILVTISYGGLKIKQLLLKQDPIKNYAPIYHELDKIGPKGDGVINARDIGFDFAFRITSESLDVINVLDFNAYSQVIDKSGKRRSVKLSYAKCD